MSDPTRQEPFSVLMKAFLEDKIRPKDFCINFTRLWMQERDNITAQAAEWSQPYDKLLIAAFQRGELSDVQFREEYMELWGGAKEAAFEEIICAVHSACSVYTPVPELEGEISEGQLRQEVADALAALSESKKHLVQAA